jgi:hypothetical protein
MIASSVGSALAAAAAATQSQIGLRTNRTVVAVAVENQNAENSGHPHEHSDQASVSGKLIRLTDGAAAANGGGTRGRLRCSPYCHRRRSKCESQHSYRHDFAFPLCSDVQPDGRKPIKPATKLRQGLTGASSSSPVKMTTAATTIKSAAIQTGAMPPAIDSASSTGVGARLT